ncbi:hypothetical protein CSIM01_12355 [Colletotrichum simmondsii]|uniref:Uncharacterized protein n=1 Tax=Colletotrichum simmondsii TaxID=703756 RepID=A0A135S6N4_9PEZI|nr:hypothetical protein CSIM01_12355 [Colletotrichum simmondsii]
MQRGGAPVAILSNPVPGPRVPSAGRFPPSPLPFPSCGGGNIQFHVVGWFKEGSLRRLISLFADLDLLTTLLVQTRAWLSDIASLEEHISRLEETNARLQVVVDNQSNHDQLGHAPEPLLPSESSRAHEASFTNHSNSDEHYHHQGRVSFASGPGPEPGPEASLSKNPPAIGLLATCARSEEDNSPPQTLPNPSFHDGGSTPRRHDQDNPLDTATETSLFDTYRNKIHYRHPFLRLDDVRDPASRPREAWASYFTNMIFSTGLLLEKPSRHHAHQESLSPLRRKSHVPAHDASLSSSRA